MERLDFKKRPIKKYEESIHYHFGDDKVQGTKKPELENQEFVNIEEEQEMEFKSILPDIKEENEEDPLKIDDIKPEITVNPETDKSKGYVLWSLPRSKNHSKLEPKKMGNISCKGSSKNKPLQKKMDLLESTNLVQSQKGKVKRSTAYTLWCQEMRLKLQKDHPNMTFGEISTNLGIMWKSVKAYEKYNYRRRARRVNELLNIQKKKAPVLQTLPPPKSTEDNKISRKGRVISKPTKLEDFYKDEIKKEPQKRKLKRTLPTGKDSPIEK